MVTLYWIYSSRIFDRYKSSLEELVAIWDDWDAGLDTSVALRGFCDGTLVTLIHQYDRYQR